MFAIRLCVVVVLLSIFVAGQARAQAQAPASVESTVVPDTLVGEYLSEDGSAIVVSERDGILYLTSGPMTFTLIPQAADRFKAKERALEFRFDGARVTVVEQGKAVAEGVRDGARPLAVAYQGPGFSAWADREIPGLLKRYRVPAAAIAYIEDGRIAFTRVYGERRRGEVAEARTMFNVASLTKPVVAEILLRLAAQGRIDLDASMSRDWIDPDLAGDPRARLLTARMALRHRTGLPNWRSQTANLLTFQTHPDSMFGYAGEGYTYAARYAEKHTGTPFEQLAERVLFEPLGMRDTSFTVMESLKRTAAYPHDMLGRELWPGLRLDYSGACCLSSTIGDYAKFLVAVMHGDALGKDIRAQRFAIRENQRHEMCGGEDGLARDLCPPRIGMGLGWFVFGYPGQTVITHTGTNDGERSSAMFVPESGLGLIVLTNGANGRKLIRDISNAAYDNPGYRRILESQAR